jgi:ring-1,2-phenylacetyl-CoA epoxidase subunit PaaE
MRAGAPTLRATGFHPLRVADVERLTDDAVAITFDVPPDLAAAFAFAPGQHLTLRAVVDGVEVRRSYSICSAPSSGRLQVAVKLLPGGVFSSHANGALLPGDVLDVMAPAGRFGVLIDPAHRKRYVAVVAGSGITPVMSLVPALLEGEPHSSVVVVYGNRTTASVMFGEELTDLKDRYPERLQLVHVLSREARDSELLTGRIEGAKVEQLLDLVVPPSTVDEWLLCGPFELVQQVRAALTRRGVDPAHVRTELFHVDGEPPRVARPRTADDATQTVTVRLDGRSTTFAMPDDGSVLDATLAVRADAPFACKGGVCGTCRALVVRGAVTMARSYALEPEEVAAGYVLTCQAVPTTPELEVDYDA